MDFLRLFRFPDTKLGIVSGSFDNLHLYDDPPEDFRAVDTYFTPAQRKPDSTGFSKKSVAGSLALWVDVDVDTKMPEPTLPPTAVVHSGHGYHLYWFLKEPLTDISEIESLNKLLEGDIPQADRGCWNADRILRVPGTPNTEPPPALVRLVVPPNGHRYAPDDIRILSQLPKKARRKIQTGDARGFPSRSERDWYVIQRLVRAGASDELIHYLFESQPIGNKVEEAHETYLPRTIAKVRESLEDEPDKTAPFQIGIRDNTFVVASGNKTRQISTFMLEPTVFLDGGTEEVDAVVCNVHSEDGYWSDVTFTRKAFTTVRNFDKEANVASWQFLGNDSDIRKLLPFLLDGLRDADAPRVQATPTLGLHFVEDEAVFVGDSASLSANEVWEGYSGPLVWLPTHREHPSMDFSEGEPDLTALKEIIPALNIPEAIWPMIGWYAASPLKPWLEAQGYRFPILHVTGPRGSGKTTLIQRVFMPLFGQDDPKSYDAGTTKFVTLSLLGSSNAVPIAFSEFRYDSVEKFLRYVLLAYDTGHDPRGRPDQTTVDYPLSAPFSLDGEDKIVDPAALQRLVIVHLRSSTINEGSSYYEARQSLSPEMWKGFGTYYIQEILTILAGGGLRSYLETSRSAVFRAFPKGLPDRIRNNLVVAYFGILLWTTVTGAQTPEASVMQESLDLVHPNNERARMLGDDLIEDIVNAAAGGTNEFFWKYEDGKLLFQMTTAHAWWLEQRRRRGRGVLERDSLTKQFPEMGFVTGPEVEQHRWLYTIDVKAAYDFGLDIPEILEPREFRFHF